MMEKIELKDIDFQKLQKLNKQGSIGTVYRKNSTCIKILDKLSTQEKHAIYEKLTVMDGIKIDGVILPKKFIMKEGEFVGYIMDYFEESMPLSDYCLQKQKISIKEILKPTKRASQILRNIHKEEIICLDLSFDNILINKDGQVQYCDMEGCCYKFYTFNYTSELLSKYLFKFQKGKKISITKNLDRVSLMLFFYLFIYQRPLQKISKRKYNQLSRHISTLENMKEYALELAKRTIIYVAGEPILPQIPYLDELINEEDEYTIDRTKQKSLFQKMHLQ